MDVSVLLETVDRLYEENRGEEAEQILLGAIAAAQDEQDGTTLLQLLNELLGYYRETFREREAFVVAEQILEISERI